jgi:hypothetical protein
LHTPVVGDTNAPQYGQCGNWHPTDDHFAWDAEAGTPSAASIVPPLACMPLSQTICTS